MKKLDPDYFLANGHKWLCSPQGSAFLYVKKELQETVHPTIMSHYFGEGYQKEFYFTGTRDYSSYLSLVEAIDFRNLLTNERVWKHNNELCKTTGTC
jgi:isopenicillin-N epimerase